MSEKRRAPTEVLERLAEAAIKLDHLLSTTGHFGATERLALNNAAADYRAAVAPLRTRAEVDAEIVATVRAKDGWHNSARLCELISEPTQDSGPSSADTEEVPSPRPPVSPAGADLIERAAWERHPIYERGKCIRTDHEATATKDTRYCRECLSKPCRWWSGWRPSGPAGVAAAKESKDNAAAPEGATNDRECNCDQALHLERRIGDAVRAIRRSSTIPAGLLHELLGILEGEA